jgi:uncharacterized delta-60 repeat protein
MEAIDENGGFPTSPECPWHIKGTTFASCRSIMRASVSFHLTAFSFFDQKAFLQTGGFAEMTGFNGVWERNAYTNADATVPFWNRGKFELDPDVDGDGGGHGWAFLKSPIRINVPLSSVQVGDMFYLSVSAIAKTFNRRQRESYLSAYFKDPLQSSGLGFKFSGLELVETPAEKPAIVAPMPAPVCATGVDPAAGKLHFNARAYAAPELPGDGATIVVTRSGGSRGAVSAAFTTSDGSAIAGVDYTPVTTQVLFADGEEGPRLVRIPILVDALAEPDKTVNLTLSDPMGCARLGQRSTAVLTIMDDDRPIETPPTFTVGGTVTGLAGTGLVLLQAVDGSELSPTNGPFVFSGALVTGLPYEVRVATQPVNPLQVCSVANGTGTIGTANVTDVVVDCATPLPNGALDPSFGIDGRVTVGLTGGATAMALQADGKIVLIGARTLARYDSDGTLDASFGAGGEVAIVFNGGLFDTAQAVAIQPDGKIVVVGFTHVGASDDFAVARYNADGSLDASFGTGGKASTDFNGSVDNAWAVLVQPDGSIVVAGHAATSTPIGVDSDFAVARFTSTGVLDTSFGTGGKVTTNIAGRTDLAHAAVLQPDGKIVLAGRVADSGGANPDVGLVRFNTDGSVDTTFGTLGIVRADLTGDWDEATGIVVQPDGKFIVSAVAVIGSSFKFALARFDAGGHLDTGFGNAGLATAPFSDRNDFAHAVALQADGRIVVVGQSSNLINPNLAVARHHADGTLDTGFGNGGTVVVDFFGASDNAACVGIQADGKIVVAGLARNGIVNGLALTRILP